MYHYVCPDCGADFEKQQKFHEHTLKVCPVCGKTKIHRVIKKVAVSFKGSGFYINDSKSSNSSTIANKPDKPAETAKDASKDASKDTATETSKEASSTAETKPAEKSSENTSVSKSLGSEKTEPKG
jgi:putative FmdB family regulatory protein